MEGDEQLLHSRPGDEEDTRGFPEFLDPNG